MIIFLNGASSAGKSTIAREIMRQSERPFLYYSINHLVELWLDEKFIALADDEPKTWLYQQFSLRGEDSTRIEGQPDVNQLRWDMIDALLVLIKKGYDLIIDEVLWHESVFQHYVHALTYAKQVYLIRIECDLIECEAREKKRADRFIGLARASYAQVYRPHPRYDFAVDSTTLSAMMAAKQILKFVDEYPYPQALATAMQAMIAFEPLQSSHFSLLKKWLNAKHVRQWWEENQVWTSKQVKSKYESYVKGYKEQAGQKKPIRAFVITCAQYPIGYIQFYSAYDFPRSHALQQLPASLAAVDFYVGEASYLQKGLAPVILQLFLSKFVWQSFTACFVDPDSENSRAIQAYRRAGFSILAELPDPKVTWMLKKQ